MRNGIVLGGFAVTLLVTSMHASQRGAAPAPAGKPGTIRACSILPAAEVKRLINGGRLFDMFKPEEEPAGSGSSCAYAGVHVQIDPFPFSTVENLQKKTPADWKAVSGVGDAAYIHNNANQYAELYARAGQHVVTVQLDIDPPHETMAKAQPVAMALASALIAKLPR